MTLLTTPLSVTSSVTPLLTVNPISVELTTSKVPPELTVSAPETWPPEKTESVPPERTLLLMVRLTTEPEAGAGLRLTVIDLSSAVGVSRAHMRKLLDVAAAEGFIERARSPHERTVVLPPLFDGMNRFFAASLLYVAYCVRAALAETPAGQPAAE